MHPRGRAPASVYWVRRALVLVVLVALLLVLRWGYHRITHTSSDAAPGPSATPTVTATHSTPTPTPTHTPTHTASATASATATAGPSSSGTPSPTATTKLCSDSDITVTASTDAASYPVGSTPKLRMRIQNTSSTPCRRDVGAVQNELVITSGAAHVWSSDDCSPGGQPDVATLQPDQSYSVTVTWLGRLSAKGCPANEPLAQAGSYKLTGRNGSVVSPASIFALT
jgi:hypothetical protein